MMMMKTKKKTSRGLGKIRENMEASLTESLGYYDMKKHKP
jgi:hypothetical protein